MQILTTRRERVDAGYEQDVEVSVPFDMSRFLNREKTTAAPHERADLIGQFVDGINKNLAAGYKAATFRQVNGQLKNLDNHRLYCLLKECQKAQKFGAFFWWKVKQMRNPQVAA